MIGRSMYRRPKDGYRPGCCHVLEMSCDTCAMRSSRNHGTRTFYLEVLKS